jgi:hypothetical protein
MAARCTVAAGCWARADPIASSLACCGVHDELNARTSTSVEVRVAAVSIVTRMACLL